MKQTCSKCKQPTNNLQTHICSIWPEGTALGPPKGGYKPSQPPQPKQKCCEKCHDVDTEHTYPAHTITEFCRDSDCECHQPPQPSQQEKRFAMKCPNCKIHTQKLYYEGVCSECGYQPPQSEVTKSPQTPLQGKQDKLHNIITDFLAKWEKDEISVAEIGLIISHSIQIAVEETLNDISAKWYVDGDNNEVVSLADIRNYQFPPKSHEKN